MDRVGVAGVRRDRDKLAKLLSVAAGRVGLAKKLRAAGRALRRGIAFKLDLCDLYGSLIDEACRRAERERIALSNHSQG
jgi:hypothetical protein